MHDPKGSRRSIVLAVWELIARHGIESVTFRRVAARAGVSVGRVQHHYGTREALVRAACAAMIEGAHDEYQALPEDPRARLRHILLHAIPDTPSGRFGAVVWHAYLAMSVDDAAIGRLLAEAKRGTETECARLIRLIGHGSAMPDQSDPRHVARRLLALADGLTVRVLIGDLSGSQVRDLLDHELVALA